MSQNPRSPRCGVDRLEPWPGSDHRGPAEFCCASLRKVRALQHGAATMRLLELGN